ncbi:MAG: Hsp33 family molecular chaperone HslO [Candidatus Competibacter sp.]
MSATIKFDGLLTLQIQANGPLRLVVVQVTSTTYLAGAGTLGWRYRHWHRCATCAATAR